MGDASTRRYEDYLESHECEIYPWDFIISAEVIISVANHDVHVPCIGPLCQAGVLLYLSLPCADEKRAALHITPN